MRTLAFLFVTALATAAQAALSPQYYEEARNTADSVVIVRVDGVRQAPRSKGFGDCVVYGRVAGVERGDRYAAGDRISIDVPCRRPNADVPASGVLYENALELGRSRWGRAYLTTEGELALYQYDILPERP